ncbi:MAG: DUF3253 domain-containing protein [Hyphomicrobiaceae bacterium]
MLPLEGGVTDAAIVAAILGLCAARSPRGTICPSEVARTIVAGEARWRALMPRVRAVAGGLVQCGAIVATQRGLAVDPVTARGPIRLRSTGGHEPGQDGAPVSGTGKPDIT